LFWIIEIRNWVLEFFIPGKRKKQIASEKEEADSLGKGRSR
jgi:hypothetical protein